MFFGFDSGIAGLTGKQIKKQFTGLVALRYYLICNPISIHPNSRFSQSEHTCFPQATLDKSSRQAQCCRVNAPKNKPMSKSPSLIQTLKKAAQRLDLNVKQIHTPEETMLGRSISISNGSRFCVISSKKTGFYPDIPVWFKMVCNSKFTSHVLLRKLGYKTIPTIFFNCTNLQTLPIAKNN